MSGILILKLNIAGSGCINFRKLLKNPLGQAEVDWRGIVYNNSWQDLYGHSFDVENNKLTVKNVRIKSKNLKKNDLLFKISNKIYNNDEYGNMEVPKLVLMRPGPGTTSELEKGRGLFDSGKYKIKNIIKICTEAIESLINRFKSNFDKIYLRIKGHSRGAVAATQIVKKLSSVFPNDDKVEIRASFYDPVPGPDFWNHFLEPLWIRGSRGYGDR